MKIKSGVACESCGKILDPQQAVADEDGVLVVTHVCGKRMKESAEETTVDSLHKCDFCIRHMGIFTDAEYDGRTKIGPWANMCQLHFKQFGVGLGLGKGQKLII